MDRLAAMQAFVEIVDRGSLTAAAESLHRSQPAMVRTLAALETHLGARLLNRTTRRMSLTEEGRDYLQRCRGILADVEDAERAAGPVEGEPEGRIRLSAPVLFGQMHIAPMLSEFLQRYERLQLELLLFDRIVDLVDEGCDVALRIGELRDSTMVATRIGQMRRVVCASPALLEEVGMPEHPTDLAGLPCVCFQGLAADDVWRFRDARQTFGVRVKTSRLRCNQAHVAAGACADGLGFAQLLMYQVQPLIEQGRLKLVCEDFEVSPLPVSLVYPSGRLLSARVRVLLDWLKTNLHEHPALS